MLFKHLREANGVKICSFLHGRMHLTLGKQQAPSSRRWLRLLSTLRSMIGVIYACPDWCTVGSIQVKKGNALGKDLESMMKEGKLVPTEVTVSLLRQAMQV